MLYGGLSLITLALAFYLFFPGAKFLGLFFSAVGAVCIIYFLLGCVSSGSSLWGIASAIQKLITVLMLLWLISFLVMQIFIASGDQSSSNSGDADYLVVLGAGLNGSEPSLVLASRLDVANDYLASNPNTVVVVTGGKGSGESITEAEAMYKYLVRKGVSPDRIIMEPNATSTIENIRFSFTLIDEHFETKTIAPKITVLSNDFHTFRAELISSKEGRSVEVVAADTPLAYLKFTYYIREYFSLIKVLFFYG